MYCPSCGGAVTQNLIYCNRCGAKLSDGTKDDGSKASEISPNILVCAMVATFMFGMAAVTMFLSAARGGNPIAIVVLAVSFLLILALESMFIWLLLRRKKVGKEVSATNRLNEQARKELYTTPAAGMLAEPIPSVTENTTSLLEPIPRDQKSKST
jgi:hypothetical protein